MLDDRPTGPHLDVTLPPSTRSVRQARHHLAEVTDGLAPGVQTTVALLTSELASNAVIHAGTPFTVTATIDRDVLRVAVSDHGRDRPAIRSPNFQGAGGWGLTLVDAAAARWGVDDDGEQTTVWFEIDTA